MESELEEVLGVSRQLTHQLHNNGSLIIELGVVQ